MYKEHLKKMNHKPGVYTTVDIPANVPILEFKGDLFTSKTFDDLQLLQINNNLYLGPSGGIDDDIGHSCNPNSYLSILGKRAILYSRYVIKTNSEITFDYSTSSTDDMNDWKMDCKCGVYSCRKVISGYQYLPEDIKEKYKQSGLVPLFLTNPILFNND